MSKFDTSLAERLYAETPDDEIGSVQELGWGGKYNEERVILIEDSQGFVQTHQFDTLADFYRGWAELEAQYSEYWEAASWDSLTPVG